MYMYYVQVYSKNSSVLAYLSQLFNHKVYSNWKKYTNKLINVKMKVKTRSLHKVYLWDVESAKPTREYIKFPIFFAFLNFGKLLSDSILFGISSETYVLGRTKAQFCSTLV